MIVLGIHDGKDAGVALVRDGRVEFAANEERYSRKKLHFGFPFLALEQMFEDTGVTPDQIDAVTTGFQAMVEVPGAGYDYTALPQLHQRMFSSVAKVAGPLMDTGIVAQCSLGLMRMMSRNKEELAKHVREAGITAPIYHKNHHLSHAASAYYFCGHDEALVVSSDGGGDGISGGIYVGRAGRIQRAACFSKLNSAGIFWEIVTQICGFNPERHGGKVTGLAAHADSEKGYSVLSRLFGYCEKSGGLLNRRHVAFRDAYKLVSKAVSGLDRAELAAGAQRILDEVFVRTVREAVAKHGIGNVALAGGTFGNVRTNLAVFEIPDVESIFVFPHMGDGGIALGSAVLHHAENDGWPTQQIENLFYGNEWSEQNIQAELAATDGICYERLDDPAEAIAECLVNKQVVGLFHGRMEFGPRALCHRSIIAEPTDTSMMDWLNERLHRTEFMPFAPVITEEDAPAYFEDYEQSRYPTRFMTMCLHCTPLCKQKAPGVVHLDGTARPQVVSADTDPYIHKVLCHYREKAGLPLAINTSFNRHEEPIVESPCDAIGEMKRIAVDVLFLESYKVTLSA